MKKKNNIYFRIISRVTSKCFFFSQFFGVNFFFLGIFYHPSLHELTREIPYRLFLDFIMCLTVSLVHKVKFTINLI